MSNNKGNKIFTNIMNTNNKCKQKSILDYFNKNSSLKRSADGLDNSVTNKSIKSDDKNVITISDENEVNASDENADKTIDISKDIANEVFIDLNQFLEIDFTVEDNNELSIDLNDGNTTEDNEVMKGSYIYQNFRQMIDFVLEDKQLSHLLDSEDMNAIQSFTCLSGLAQMLFMRLFMRNRIWIRKSSIKYPEISDNLTPILEDLVDNQFLINATQLSDLTEALIVLDRNEMKKIGKSLNGLNMNGLNTKKNISAAVMKYLNTCQPVFKCENQSNSVKEILIKSIQSTLRNKCFKVNQSLCDVFERMFLLFCPPEISDEDFNSQLSFEFFKILKVESGREVYPNYTITSEAVIYKTRDDLVRYCQAFKLEIQILSAIESKELDEVINNLLLKAKHNYLMAIEAKVEENDSFLPSFLRRYTGGQTYIRCLSHCITVLEQKKNHLEAVSILKDILLKQTIYCEDCRGRWFERLALNLDKHLKDPKTALEVIEKGLSDESVQTGHRLALYIRQKKIQKSLKMSVSTDPQYEDMNYSETTIFAEIIKYTINDRKHIFKTTDANGDVTVMPVEDIVINHYKQNGFSDGLHTEGRIYHTIFGLLFWDIIYLSDCSEVCDAFRFRFQRFPLDFNSKEFYKRRKTQINSLLDVLRNLNETEISNILENSFNKNVGTVSLINWENVDINQIKEIAVRFGSSILTDICERLIKDFRHTRSGFPDLLLWDKSTKRIKAVEVKGPNDRPSTKQRLWLSYLQSIGLDVEICHVKVKKAFPVSESIA